MGEKSEAAQEPRRKRVDLSLPQVAGSAVAAVVAAKLASYFGVYGTILGAGVVSVIATCGGTVFQHFFKRTGEQIRDATAQGRPVRPGPAREPGAVTPAYEFGEGTVYRARARGRRRPLIAAALVFGVTMAGITTYELVSGDSFSGGGGTTVRDALTGNNTSSSADSTPSPDPSSSPSASQESGTPTGGDDSAPGDGSTQEQSPAQTPDATPSQDGDGDSGEDATSPAPTPSGSAATTPEPGASSRSGSDAPDQADPSER
ncbi:hypothetical protein ACFV6E_08320 [Streptomyces sp. NPDC059785]|uniref:hypothetical protein n=1 Tax=Streptomyces sp. NPDC059785 TaxID=3346945 RepID=UPI003647D660